MTPNYSYKASANDGLFLRKAESSDLDLLFEFANDEIARSNAFSMNKISYDEHKLWFERMMNDPSEVQYVLMDSDIPCGQIRFSVSNDEAEIDYSISKQFRHNGYGKDIIRLAKSEIQSEYPEVKKLIGKVKPSNTASINCFLKNGFEEKFRQLEFSLNETGTGSSM